jgi:mRNA interferase RelE/StbE
MKTDFKKSFLKDLQKLTNQKLKSNILQTILQVEEAGSVSEIKNLKRLSGF